MKHDNNMIKHNLIKKYIFSTLLNSIIYYQLKLENNIFTKTIGNIN